MGIQIEFNPDLALRKFGTDKRAPSECLPKILEEGRTYEFLKSGQRNYWLKGEIPLLETEGNGQLSTPLASIQIIETTHFLDGKNIWTKGKYLLIKIIKPEEIYFNGFNRVK